MCEYDIAGEVHHSPERTAIETVYLKFSERDTMGRVVIVDRPFAPEFRDHRQQSVRIERGTPTGRQLR